MLTCRLKKLKIRMSVLLEIVAFNAIPHFTLEGDEMTAIRLEWFSF